MVFLAGAVSQRKVNLINRQWKICLAMATDADMVVPDISWLYVNTRNNVVVLMSFPVQFFSWNIIAVCTDMRVVHRWKYDRNKNESIRQPEGRISLQLLWGQSDLIVWNILRQSYPNKGTITATYQNASIVRDQVRSIFWTFARGTGELWAWYFCFCTAAISPGDRLCFSVFDKINYYPPRELRLTCSLLQNCTVSEIKYIQHQCTIKCLQ